MDDITLLQECVVKVEEEDNVNAPVAVLLQPKVEMEEETEKQEVKTGYSTVESPGLEQNDSEETKPIATLHLISMEEEQLEDHVAVDPLADCEEWNEKKPLTDTLLLRVKKEGPVETDPVEEVDAGVSNERCEQKTFKEIRDDAEDASGRAESPSEEPEKGDVPTHTKRQPFGCVLCSETFRLKKKLKEHECEHREAEKETKFPCETCGKEFKRRSHLKVHLLVHTGERPYICDQCGKGFRQSSHFNVHLRMHTGERPYGCSICNKRFSHKNNLLRHTRQHLNIKPFECKECGKTFVESCHTHLRIHTRERPYKCSICSKTFARKGNLNRNIFTHSRDPKQMSQCEVCGESYHTTYMNRHMQTHTGERPLKCGYCDKMFTHSSNRNTHEVTHTREYPYNCAECRKGYVRKGDLFKHLQTHGN